MQVWLWVRRNQLFMNFEKEKATIGNFLFPNTSFELFQNSNLVVQKISYSNYFILIIVAAFSSSQYQFCGSLTFDK